MYLDILTAATVRLRPKVMLRIGRDDTSSIVFEMATRADTCMRRSYSLCTPLLCDAEFVSIQLC
jgi:hypothetical protein